MKSLKNYKLSWNDFSNFFKRINDEVNDYLENIENSMTEEKIRKDYTHTDSINPKEIKGKLISTNPKSILITI